MLIVVGKLSIEMKYDYVEDYISYSFRHPSDLTVRGQRQIYLETFSSIILACLRLSTFSFILLSCIQFFNSLFFINFVSLVRKSLCGIRLDVYLSYSRLFLLITLRSYFLSKCHTNLLLVEINSRLIF